MNTIVDASALPPGVAAVLARLGATPRLHGHPRLPTSEALRPYLEAHGFDPARMLKTLALRTPPGCALVTLRMHDRVDYGAVARALGTARSALAMMDAPAMQAALGMEPGAVCPFVDRSDVAVLLDEAALAPSVICCGSGVLSCTVEIASAALRALPGARVGTFAKAGA